MNLIGDWSNLDTRSSFVELVQQLNTDENKLSTVNTDEPLRNTNNESGNESYYAETLNEEQKSEPPIELLPGYNCEKEGMNSMLFLSKDSSLLKTDNYKLNTEQLARNQILTIQSTLNLPIVTQILK